MDRRVATMITRQLRQAEKYKDNCLSACGLREMSTGQLPEKICSVGF